MTALPERAVHDHIAQLRSYVGILDHAIETTTDPIRLASLEGRRHGVDLALQALSKTVWEVQNARYGTAPLSIDPPNFDYVERREPAYGAWLRGLIDWAKRF